MKHMKKSISIYSTIDSNGEEGKKRCIYEEILKEFKHIYTFEYLIQYFERKARDYFAMSIDDDEKFYEHRKLFPDDDNFTTDFSCRDNYFSTLQIVWVVKTLKAFYDRGYNFKVIEISSERQGWIMNFTFDFCDLTKEQIDIILMNAFEQNQLTPERILD